MSKPFVARGSNVQRCKSCLLSERVCICSFKTSYAAKARFFLMMHHNESFKPTNTGRLIEDCIERTERFKWSRTEPDDAFLRAVYSPDVDPYIVFPEGKGYEDRMVDYQPKEGKQPVFIILDGTWRQARRMFRHSRYLDSLPVIQPVVESTSEYRLRKAAVEGQLCTAEVAAEMLRMVHDKKGSELLSAYFRIFNEHYRASRLTRPIVEDTSDKTFIREWQEL